MYLLADAGGWPAQRALWTMVTRGALVVTDLAAAEVAASHRLMEKYKDVPMDLADATLVSVADARRLKRVFTLDSDFAIYRLRGRDPFEIVPT